MMRNELYHYGKGHDDNPPGRGSGRYPYGSSGNVLRKHERKKPSSLSMLSTKKRYYNENGTLNSLGVKTLRSFQTKRKSAESELKAFGVTKNSDGSYTMSKGTYMGRYANEGEPLDERRKYVFVTDSDHQRYRSSAEYGFLEADPDKPVRGYTYQADHDLKIAPHDVVADVLLRKFGDAKLSTIADTYNGPNYMDDSGKAEYRESLRKAIDKIGAERISDIMRDAEDIKYDVNPVYQISAIGKELQSYVDAGQHILYDYYNETFTQLKDRAAYVETELRKLGYDGAVDVEDYVTSSFEFPVIIYAPDKNLKKRGSK